MRPKQLQVYEFAVKSIPVRDALFIDRQALSAPFSFANETRATTLLSIVNARPKYQINIMY